MCSLSMPRTALEIFIIDQKLTEVYSDEASTSKAAQQPLQASRPPIVKYKGKSVLRLIRVIFTKRKVFIMMRYNVETAQVAQTRPFNDKARSKINLKVIYYSFKAFLREIY